MADLINLMVRTIFRDFLIINGGLNSQLIARGVQRSLLFLLMSMNTTVDPCVSTSTDNQNCISSENFFSLRSNRNVSVWSRSVGMKRFSLIKVGRKVE